MSGTSRRGWLVAALLVASVPAAAADLWVAVPLYNSGFEDWDGGLPAGWGREPWIRPEECTEPGAILRSDDAAAGQAALLLQGGPRSCRFDAVLQELPAEPGQVYRLRARLRSVDVDSTGRRFTNANAFLASGDGANRTFAHALTPFLAGTTDWAEHTTSLALTPGVTRLKVGAFLSVPGELRVDDMRLERLTPPAPAIDAPRAERWAQDLDYLGELVEFGHPDPWAHLSRADFRAGLAGIAAAAARPDGPDDTALAWQLRALTCRLGDPHTATELPEGGLVRLPLSLRFFGSEVRVVAGPPALASLVGGRLSAIDGHPVADVLAAIDPQIARTHENWFREQAPSWLINVGALHQLGMARLPDALTFTVVHDDGTERTATASLATPTDGEWVVAGPPEGQRPLSRRRGGSYWFEYLPDSRTLYFKYDQARDDPERPLRQFGVALFEALNANPIDRFVLDVRHNSGGQNQINGVFRDLAARLTDGRVGQAFVIVGRRTFSAAVYDADAMRTLCGAVVVGEPTGMAPVHPGQVGVFTLPGTGIGYATSTKIVRASRDTSPALMPDIPAEVSWADFLAGRDPLLEAVLAYELK